jgi:hypothetical protein
MSAQPAQPILASALFDSLNATPNEPVYTRSSKTGKRVPTGCVAVDDALEGGLDYGKGGVCLISAEGAEARIVGCTFVTLCSITFSLPFYA